MILPFVGMLLLHRHPAAGRRGWFGKNRNRAIVAAALRRARRDLPPGRSRWRGPQRVGTTLEDYISFITLLASLFIVSGGIFLTGDPLGTPRTTSPSLASAPCWPTSSARPAPPWCSCGPLLRANRERTLPRAHRGVLDLHRVQHRRPAHAARRPAPLPRLPQRRELLVDAAPLPHVGARRRPHAARVLRLRASLPPRRRRAHPGGRRRLRAAGHRGQDQHPLPARHRRSPWWRRSRWRRSATPSTSLSCAR